MKNVEINIEKEVKLFAEKMKKLRKEKGEKEARKITIAIASEEMKIHANALSNYEYDRFPQIEQLMRIKEYYNVSTDFLLGYTDIKRPDSDVQAIHEFTALSEPAINFLRHLKESSEKPFTMQDKLNGKPLRTTFSNSIYTEINIINFLIENYQDKYRKNTNDSIIQILRRYFNYSPNPDEEIILMENGGAKIREKGKTVGGYRFPSEQLSDMFLVFLQTRLKDYRDDYKTWAKQFYTHKRDDKSSRTKKNIQN